MNREKLNLSREHGRLLVWGDLEGFETVEDNILHNGRWSINHRIVVRRKSDGKFFADDYSLGATECQGERAYENSVPDFTEVFPIEKKVIIYE